MRQLLLPLDEFEALDLEDLMIGRDHILERRRMEILSSLGYTFGVVLSGVIGKSAQRKSVQLPLPGMGPYLSNWDYF
jgi:hypothetical protein